MLQVFVEHLDGPQSQRNVFDYRGLARSRPLRCSDDVSVAGGGVWYSCFVSLYCEMKYSLGFAEGS